MEETVTDLSVLQQFMRYQDLEPAILIQTLETLMAVCSSARAKTTAHELGITTDLIHILKASSETKVKVSVLSCLGEIMANQYEIQIALTKSDFFTSMKEIFEQDYSNLTVFICAAYCCACISKGNSAAQTKMRSSGCLSVLTRKVTECTPDKGTCTLQQFSVLINALSSLVNNPQNDVNQQECAMAFPSVLIWVSTDQDCTTCPALLTFLCLSVASNRLNQERLRNCNGIKILMTYFHQVTNKLKFSNTGAEMIPAVASCMDSLITQNLSNCELCGQEGIMDILLELLQDPQLKVEQQVPVMMCLAHATDICLSNKYTLIRDGLGTVISHMSSVEDEMPKLVRYILLNCVSSELSSGTSKTFDLNLEGTNIKNPYTRVSSQESKMSPTISPDICSNFESPPGVCFKNITTQSIHSEVPTTVYQNILIGDTLQECPACQTNISLNSRNMKQLVLKSDYSCTYHKFFCCL